MTDIVHAVPPPDSGLTPCCGRNPIELPRDDQISSEKPTTCPGAAVVCPPGVHSLFDPCPGDCTDLLPQPEAQAPAPTGALSFRERVSAEFRALTPEQRKAYLDALDAMYATEATEATKVQDEACEEPAVRPEATLQERIAAAARTVRLRLGPNAVALAQRGEPLRLSGGEADAVAEAVIAAICEPIPSGMDTASWTAIRALQIANEAGDRRREMRAERDAQQQRADRAEEKATRAETVLEIVRSLASAEARLQLAQRAKSLEVTLERARAAHAEVCPLPTLSEAFRCGMCEALAGDGEDEKAGL